MMTITQFYLGKVDEEAIEIAKEALKAQQFGLSERHSERVETNAQRIYAEMNDLLAMVHQLGSVSGGEFYFNQDGFAMATKLNKVAHYLVYSQSLGLVEAQA
jgi:ketosteroid isomerase-like protein